MTAIVAANPTINNTNVGELMGMMGKFAIAEFNEWSFSRIYHAVREVLDIRSNSSSFEKSKISTGVNSKLNSGKHSER